tara:strand:- start:591 stop:794 length:204 start_codon:yes stop_codon:yes gene_type:complete
MNPEARGKGLANAFLKSSITKYFKINKNHLVAIVREDNLPSRKIFSHAGFEAIYNKNNKVYYKKYKS